MLIHDTRKQEQNISEQSKVRLSTSIPETIEPK